MKAEVPTVVRSQYAIQAIDALFDRPIFRIADFIQRSGIPAATARRILNALRGKGGIEELRSGRGRRAAILVFRELIDITEG